MENENLETELETTDEEIEAVEQESAEQEDEAESEAETTETENKAKPSETKAKVSNPFMETIKAYLDSYSETDSVFKERYNNPDKNINECCNYILNTVQKSGCNGFTDDEEGNGYHALWYKGQTPKQMGKNRPYFENANHDISLLVNGTSKAVYLG